jgi:hypothetical protein
MVNSAFPVPGLGLNRPSMDEWILATVQDRGGLTLDQLASTLPQPNWSQVFLAVDRLSRAGSIRLLVTAGKDYHISLNPKREKSS